MLASEAAPVRGVANANLAEVSNADAAELIREHDKLVWFAMRKVRSAARRQSALMTEDDLLTIGRTALIRAWVTWKPSRGAWSTHAVLCITRSFWRALQLERRDVTREVPVTTATDPHWFADPNQPRLYESGDPPERGPGKAVLDLDDVEGGYVDQLERESQLVWLSKSIHSPLLSPRQRNVLVLYLEGLSFDEIAARLVDITRQGVQLQFKVAVGKLQAHARRAVRRRV